MQRPRDLLPPSATAKESAEQMASSTEWLRNAAIGFNKDCPKHVNTRLLHFHLFPVSYIDPLSKEICDLVAECIPFSTSQELIAVHFSCHENALVTNNQHIATVHQQKQGRMHDLLTSRVRVMGAHPPNLS
jgi:hypothetical protein